MQLSKNLKMFAAFLLHLKNLHKISIFEKQMSLQAQLFFKINNSERRGFSNAKEVLLLKTVANWTC